ncbi:MAG: tripartite tricarboxylate transporter substrate binding protein [Betaproteobacteria bacterium]|nr:tripartite tricarboxylate transporter substrate binding protein [Betaproteobacteria bacterium]
MSNVSRFVACFAFVLAAGLAVAQPYPSKAVRIIVPFPPGAGVDIVTRAVSGRFSEALGQQLIIDNRAGAGGILGAELATKAAPDGYTLLMGTAGMLTVIPHLNSKAPYSVERDFSPVSQVASVPSLLVVHPSLPVKSVKELIALAKAKPGQIDYASSGNGSTQHLTGALFASMAGINMTHIPYRGSGPVTSDLLGGQVMVAFPGIAGMLPHIKSGKLRALGVTGSKRSAELPAVPTIAEGGVKGYEMVAWFGVATPKGLPRDVQTKLHGELLRVLKTPEMSKSLQNVGQEPAWQDTPEKFLEFMKVEAAKWAKVVKASGAVIE